MRIPDWLTDLRTEMEANPVLETFRVQGLAIEFWASDPKSSGWIAKYIHTLIEHQTGEPDCRYRLNCLYSDDVVHAAMRYLVNNPNHACRLKQRRQIVDRVPFTSALTLECNPEQGVVWVTDSEKKTVTLVTSTRTTWPMMEVTSCFREIAKDYLQDRGWHLIHSGAMRIGDANYLVIGDGGQGKTSLILELMCAGAHFISNERLFAKKIDDHVHVLPFPMPVAVGLGSAMQYPELVHFIDNPELCLCPLWRMNIERVHATRREDWPKLKDKIQFVPDELIEALSASVGHPGGAVDGVIVPRLSNDGSPNAKRLDFDDVNEVVGFNFIHHENTYPSWMRLNFNPAPPETSADIIDTLSALPAIQISFLASPERRGSVSEYLRLIEDISQSN